MTLENVVWLVSEQAQGLLQAHADADPAQFALQWQPKIGVHAALIATQLHLRKKAQIKLPTWAAAGCLFHPEGYEQATAEATLKLKRYGAGSLALDLTAGIGIDAWHLAKHYKNVIALERDPVRVALLRYNLGLLRVSNVTPIEADSIAWLQAYAGPNPDLIYVDPSRRTGARVKAIALADMEPDLRASQTLLLEKCKFIIVKLSPLFELAELPRAFTHLAEVRVISVAGECKEVVATMLHDAKYTGEVQAEMLINNKHVRFTGLAGVLLHNLVHSAIYLYEPDVAFYKADLIGALLARYYPDVVVHATGSAGLLLSDTFIADFPGRAFQVVASMPYKPAALLLYLKANRLFKANVTRRAFPHRVAELRKKLKLSEGGDDYLFFTETPAGLYCYHTRKV